MVSVFDEWLSLQCHQGWPPDGPAERKAKRMIESDIDKTKAAWGVFEEI